MNLCDIKTVKQIMAMFRLTFHKEFGQNFLTDRMVVEDIADECCENPDSTILEIGPGIGTLTRELALRHKNVVCLEIDRGLIPVLGYTLEEFDNVRVINEDVMKIDLAELVSKYSEGKPVSVCANLPYYITTPIIMKFVEECILPQKFIIMVQKEVAYRLSAEVGSRDYGSLTVFLNYYYEISKLFDVSRNCFTPKPNVDSAIVEMKLKDNRLKVVNDNLFRALVRDSFLYKRKTIRNNLKKYDLSVIENVLNKHGFDLSVRAEALSLEIFVEMANELALIK